jgi:hypothetical protein
MTDARMSLTCRSTHPWGVDRTLPDNTRSLRVSVRSAVETGGAFSRLDAVS